MGPSMSITPDVRERLKPHPANMPILFTVFDHQNSKEQVVLVCSDCGFARAKPSKPHLNPDMYFKQFRHSGWEVDNRGRNCSCPACVEKKSQQGKVAKAAPTNTLLKDKLEEAQARLQLKAAHTPRILPALPVVPPPAETPVLAATPVPVSDPPADEASEPDFKGMTPEQLVKAKYSEAFSYRKADFEDLLVATCANTASCSTEWRMPYRPDLAVSTIRWHLTTKSGWFLKRNKTLAFCPACAKGLPSVLPAGWTPGDPLPGTAVTAKATPVPTDDISGESPDMFVKRVYGNAFCYERSPHGEPNLLLKCVMPSCDRSIRRRFDPTEDLSSVQGHLLAGHHWLVRNKGKWAFCPTCSKGVPQRLPSEWTPDQPLPTPLKEKRDMEAKAPHLNGSHHPAANGALNGAAARPSAEALANRRKANELLLEFYDPTGKRYTGGYTDARVAKESSLSESAVAKLREEYYGPLEISAELSKLLAELPALKEEMAACKSEMDTFREMFNAALQRHEALCSRVHSICITAQRQGLYNGPCDPLSSSGKNGK